MRTYVLNEDLKEGSAFLMGINWLMMLVDVYKKLSEDLSSCCMSVNILILAE